jgi:hypothetical protein
LSHMLYACQNMLHFLCQIVRNLENSYVFADVYGMEIMMKP